MKYFYFRRSHDSRSQLFRVPLKFAIDQYHQVCESPKATLSILKRGELGDNFTRNFYRRLTDSHHATAFTWSMWTTLPQDFIFYFDQHIGLFRKWVDCYENVILPNYSEREWENLHIAPKFEFPTPLPVYQTVYEELAECDSRTVSGIILDQIVNQFPSPHTQRAIELARSREININYRTARVRLANLPQNSPYNRIVQSLLLVLSDGHDLEARLLEEIDILDHGLFDLAWSQLIQKPIPPCDPHRRTVAHIKE